MGYELSYDPVGLAITAAATRLRVPISPIEADDLAKFHIKYFKDFAIPEIPLAFELLAAGIIELPEGESHYGTMSPEYWGLVMKAMRAHRLYETKKETILLGTIDDSQMKILTPEETEELNNKAMREGVLKSWDIFKQTKVMPYSMDNDLITAHHFQWLRRKGIMEEISEDLGTQITAEANEYYAEVIENRKESPSLSQQRLKELSMATGQEDNKRGKIKALCQKIAVRCFFENLLLEEKDLHELIENNHAK